MKTALPLSLLLVLLVPTALDAQEAAEARTADVASIDGIVTAFYEVVSGPTGEPRDWERDATLYLPGVTFTPADVQDGAPVARTQAKDEWIAGANRFLVESGFVEREIHRVTRQFGNVAQVASAYEWETAAGETGRGVNFIHLFHDGERWWITHATWDSERPDNPIPSELLPQ